MRLPELTTALKAEAARLGFDQLGIAPAVPAPGYPDFLNWLKAGHASGMDYLEKHAPARRGPESVLDGVRSVIMASMVYGEPSRDAPTASSRSGKVARYARGGDYHPLIWSKLGDLLAWLKLEIPEVRGRAVSDTAPLLERDFARLAGLGWIGKNTMLINKRLGSFTFLGALLVDVELEYDARHETNHCGTCRRCLDACPTDAFVGPYELDAGRCISYWTIEHRGALPGADAERLNGWVFGCDVCQDVCPWNRKAPPGGESDFSARPEWMEPDLIAWLDRDRLEWSTLLKGTALKRAKRVGLVRNAALVLGERRLLEAVPALAARLDDASEEVLIRTAAAWALGRMKVAAAAESLARNRNDANEMVRAAVSRAERESNT